MAARRDVSGIKPYDAPAGGWGALKATAKTVYEQMNFAGGPKVLLQTNQPDGFDCPGCAWPDAQHTSTFQFCENGAKAVTWEATSKRATPEFFAAHTVAELWNWSDHALENEGRLTHPMAYDKQSDTFRPMNWQDAFARIGTVLRALPDPNMAEFYTSGRASNEAAFLFQLFAREFGTNNFPDCSNMCHEATSVGLPKSIGIGKGTVSLADFAHSELVISVGHNPGTNHPRMMGTLHEVARRGVPIIVLNPMRERALERFADPQSPVEMATFGSTNIATHYYQVKVGGDLAAIKGIMKALLALEDARGEDARGEDARGEDAYGEDTHAEAVRDAVFDHDFIARHTNGIAALIADLRATGWAAIEAASGLSRADLENVARLYAKSNSTLLCYGMGVTQHRGATATVQQLANLLLLRGNFGKPGAGICPLRGHSNVQGDRTVGITEKPNAKLLEGIERVFGFTPPATHGHDAVAAMQAMAAGTSKILIALGGNLPVAMPDPAVCFAAMRGLKLAVHIATKLNRSHLLIGEDSIILPCLGRTEKDVQVSGQQSVTVEDSMSMVHASRGNLPPASPLLRSEPAIIAGMAAATLPGSKVDWSGMIADYDRIRDAIEGVFPDFANFNQRVRKPGGFRLPLPPTERIWPTPTGKAEFLVFEGLREDPHVDDPRVLTMTTIRSHDQYNTTIYGMDDRYRGVFGRRDVMFMNEDDLDALGLAHGDKVDVEAMPDPGEAAGQPLRIEGITAVAYNIARGSVAAYYPEMNGLVALGHHDPQSGTPAYKSIPVRITPCSGSMRT